MKESSLNVLKGEWHIWQSYYEPLRLVLGGTAEVNIAFLNDFILLHLEKSLDWEKRGLYVKILTKIRFTFRLVRPSS